MNFNLTKSQLFLILLVASGFALSIFQFLYNRSLWLDEAALSLNIIKKNPFQLLQPLDYSQVAPILYLQIVYAFNNIN